MRRWRTRAVERLFHHRLFDLERRRLAAGAEEREALVLTAPEWINVVPLLPDRRVVLVRQWRFGIEAPTLEIPGGMVEGESPRRAAERELVEETGYRAARWVELGVMHPNPAFLSNRLTTFLATGLERIGEPQNDGDEETFVETVALDEIPGLIDRGEITHSLVIAGFYLLDRHLASGAGESSISARG